MAALGTVKEPELGRDLVSLNMIKDLTVSASRVSFTVELTTPACPLKERIERESREAVMRVPGVEQVDMKLTSNVRAHSPTSAQGAIPGVRNVIAVASGKGGVGKSTVAANLAVALAGSGARVGLLDADIYGPTIPGLLGLTAWKPKVKAMPDGQQVFEPPVAHDVKVNSLGFLLEDPSQPVIWRGPMVGSGVKQLLGQTDWGELDYLLVDLPPGTGDATLTLAQSIPLSGVVIVSQPQDVALAIAIKALRAFREQLKVRVLGVLENMSYFVCDNCDKRHDIFSHGGACRAAERLEVPFLGEIPLSADVCESSDTGTPVVALKPDSPQAVAFVDVAKALAAQVSIAGFSQRKVIPLRPV